MIPFVAAAAFYYISTQSLPGGWSALNASCLIIDKGARYERIGNQLPAKEL